MRTVIITGATSFIGKRMCRYFLESGDRVYAVVRKQSEELDETITQICLEMDDYSALADQLPENCDIGILLAWDGTRGASRNDEALQQKNIKNCQNALQCLWQKSCKTIVFSGTQAEYGPQYHNRPVCETTPPMPDTAYGKAKLAFGMWAEAFCSEHSLRFLHPRIFSIYGEGDYAGTLTMSLLDKMRNNLPCEMTQCIQLWDYLYIDDAVAMIAGLIEATDVSGVYNIASGEVKPLKDFVMEMYRITGSQSELRFGAIPYPPAGMVNINPDIRKIREVLGDLSLYSFEEGVKKALSSMTA